MTTRPYLRSSLARSLYEKMVRDDNLRTLDKSKVNWVKCKSFIYAPLSTLSAKFQENRLGGNGSDIDFKILPKQTNRKTEKQTNQLRHQPKENNWYNVNLDLVDCEIKDAFFQSKVDGETEDFLENCYDKSDWLMTQIFHALARSLMCWFMSRTSINGFLGRGSMFVFSSAQFENIVSPYSYLREDWASRGNLLDLGAGDGKVTDVMAPHFRHTYVTEISGVMGRILTSKNYRLLDVNKWANADEGPRYFDLISCLNLLDRCDRPITLLQQIRNKLNPDTGLLILAVVLPLNQYVESGSKYHQPSEKIVVKGKTFEEQVSSLTETLFSASGFRVVRWTRLPYLCEGDLDQAFYWLNDALFVLEVAEPCDTS